MMEEIKILKEIKNPLFNRREIQFELHAKVTPKKAEVEKLISEKFSASPEKIKVKQIIGRFGSNNFVVKTNIYETKEERDKIEFKSKKEKEVEAKSKQE